MHTRATPPTVLLVDDNAAQRAALTVALAELQVPVVEADSGRDALRALLRQTFAVILLDVNMPGLDGFETAALIRQRPSSEHTPIIFVTAHEDDAYALRGYAMGAVDYILSPVQPNVLRAKVSVFIDLYRNAEEIRVQRQMLERYSTQLRQLSEASLAIFSAAGFDDLLSVVAENASRIIGARQASVSALAPHNKRLMTAMVTLPSSGRAQGTIRIAGDVPALRLQQVMRLPNAGDRGGVGLVPSEVVPGQPLRGWMGAPLVARDGRTLGVIQLSEKIEGDFNGEDEDLLSQLARMAATTLDNAAAAEAREANRLKDEFLGVLSHELRTPLQAIIAWVDIMRQQASEGSMRQAADVVERSAQAQMRLINDLLDVSRIARGQLQLEREHLELGQIVRQALETVRATAVSRRIAVAFDVPGGTCPVEGDATRLQQVAWNLLSNALKFTPEGGRVEVSLANEGNHVVLRVLDNGPGIAEAFLPFVFERFRQADSSAARPYGGLGLGLAIVRHLVEIHGGEVAAANAPDAGAIFTVRLPRASGATVALTGPVEVPPAESRSTRLDGIHVLLVEDEVDSRDALAEVLQCLGANVEAVGSAAAALQAVQARVPDVLVSDVGMPGEDGYSLIQQLRSWEQTRGGGLPAIALTAYARIEDRVAALRSGFDAHVHKPVEPAQLAQLVKQLARRA